MEQILLIDDNKAYCEQVQKTLALRGIELQFYIDGKEGLRDAIQKNWDVILLDVFLDQVLDGLDILKQIVVVKPQLPVIMISGASTLQTAVEATKMGAYDFLEKPIDVERLLLTIKRALEKNKLLNLSQTLYKELSKQFTLVGKSEAIQKIYHEIDRVARTDAKVFICGESGVGKDLIAKLLHYQSDREPYPFVSINCAAIPNSLVEAELFGYVKGAFTGATESKEGLIAMAEKGTLFLDEIIELPVNSQAKLLKFLNDGQYNRVGSTKTIQSDVRIIAATNKDLNKEIKAGRFRRDLYYRLNVVNINIPPLRNRVEDIPVLSEFFLRRACKKFGKTITHFSGEAIELIKKQRWLGNVRQLKAAIYRMVLFTNSNIIDYGTAATAIQMDRTNEIVISASSYEQALEEFEKLYFLNQLNTYNWKLDIVALEAGLNIESLHQKLNSLNIKINSKSDDDIY
jgi:two-component system nitrogen regulation response regulator NtrX